uniref:Uncharacterized protein n=1 Tax=Leersia perrieri TaxID=77586 RepID=A0A0D9W9R8_9ORYZ
MSGEVRNSMAATSTGRSGLGGGGAKSITPFAAASFFLWGHRGARSLVKGTKYGTTAPSPAAAAGAGDDGAGAIAGEGEDGDEGGARREAELGFRRRSLASRRRARAPGRRKRWWSAAAAAEERGLRVAAMWARCVGERPMWEMRVVETSENCEMEGGYLKGLGLGGDARALGAKKWFGPKMALRLSRALGDGDTFTP